MERYVLIGLRGSGKSAIGRKMAEKLQIPLYDTDRLIEERGGRSIPEIFSYSGEVIFRQMEREVISSLPDGPAVIATGGGAVMDPENTRRLRRRSHIILLTADEEILHSRIQGSSRPALTHLSDLDEIRHLAGVRMPVFRGLADLCIDTGSLRTDEAAARIIHLNGMRRRNPELFAETLAAINQDTQDNLIKCPLIFGITGNPVSHSRSPHLYNSLFPEYAIPGKYLFLPANSAEDAIRIMRGLGAKGLSVTIPFKEMMISCIDEPDADAHAIGAVNTVLSCNGRLYGHNTDWIGICSPIRDLRGGNALVVGAGGAAAAAVYALQSLEMDVTISNRTEKRGEVLAERFGCRSAPLSSSINADLIVNATPVGMKERDHSPVPSGLLKPGVTVFDLVYTPPMTPLLREAEAAGCRIISGTEMFIHQARAQFILFTGIDPGIERIREVLS
ncbi:shikimate dehydrogenase [Methanocalculus taiwanensis]|uniref:Shikimate dehydrogenase (NADP(+)) n=1 Tax=Methanocalculus taiwanensis TaxID=106207 RepID=A0ABD4TF68_9EURY|nr:shikimate dehydrogenase [Methanocalculus taiwanensis]MCQ1537634.1 shikimate dehydrogenase [Methanocalculus taiwanensis]